MTKHLLFQVAIATILLLNGCSSPKHLVLPDAPAETDAIEERVKYYDTYGPDEMIETTISGQNGTSRWSELHLQNGSILFWTEDLKPALRSQLALDRVDTYYSHRKKGKMFKALFYPLFWGGAAAAIYGFANEDLEDSERTPYFVIGGAGVVGGIVAQIFSSREHGRASDTQKEIFNKYNLDLMETLGLEERKADVEYRFQDKDERAEQEKQKQEQEQRLSEDGFGDV